MSLVLFDESQGICPGTIDEDTYPSPRGHSLWQSRGRCPTNDGAACDLQMLPPRRFGALMFDSAALPTSQKESGTAKLAAIKRSRDPAGD